MFLRKIKIEFKADDGAAKLCDLHWIDNFAMRSFTANAIFDDTLPAGQGWLEVGYRVPLPELAAAMQDWFHRKGYMRRTETILLTEFAALPEDFSEAAEPLAEVSN